MKEKDMEQKIWRYLDFAKFTHLISTKKLHFTRIDQFKDKFEGSYPVPNLQDWDSQFPEVGDFKNYRNFICVSCWYKSDRESAAMWEIYGANGQGVAICSTITKLNESFQWNFHIPCQEVQYIDFIRDKAPIYVPTDVWKYKRIEFKSEHEFRAALIEVPPSPGSENDTHIFGSVDNQEGFPKEGMDIPVTLDVLIEKVAFSPYVKKRHQNKIRELADHYGLYKEKIVNSDLASDPVYPKQ